MFSIFRKCHHTRHLLHSAQGCIARGWQSQADSTSHTHAHADTQRHACSDFCEKTGCWRAPVFHNATWVSMIFSCVWHKRPYQLSQRFLSKAQLISHRHVGAYWKEGSAPISSIPRTPALPLPLSLSLSRFKKKRSLENQLNLEEDVDGWRLWEGKANNVRSCSSQWCERKQRVRKVNCSFHVSLTCAFCVCSYSTFSSFWKMVKAATGSWCVASR